MKRVITTARGGSNVLKLVKEKKPQPRENEILVKTLTAGIARADLLWQSGMIPGGPKVGFTPGYDAVGIIDAVGENINSLKEGDDVAVLQNYGCYSEYICTETKHVVPIPSGLDPVLVNTLPLNYMTAYGILKKDAQVVKGERVLVQGASGGVGTAILDLGSYFELEVFGTSSKSKHEALKDFDAILIDYETESFVDRIMEMTKGEGVDVAIDHMGGAITKKSFNLLRKGGRCYSLSALGSAEGQFGKLGVVWSLFLRNILWSILPNGKKAKYFDTLSMLNNKEQYISDIHHLIKLMNENEINPLIAKIFPFEDVKKAQVMMESSLHVGKIILDMR